MFAADALDMMMVAFLRQADFALKAQYLFAVFAHLAVHQIGAFTDFGNPIGEGVEYLRVVVQIRGLHELDVGMVRGHQISVIIDPLDQDSGEQKIGEHDDPAVAELDRVLEGGLYQREGHSGIGGLSPAKSQTFPQHAGHFGDVGIGIRVGCAPADGDQHGLLARHNTMFGIGGFKSLQDPVSGGTNHLQIDAQLAAIDNLDAGILGRIGVEHGRDVVLGVAGSKQHAGHRVDTLHAPGDQLVEAVTDDRGREFQKAVFDLLVRETCPQGVGDNCKFAHGAFVTTAMAAHHNAKIFGHELLLLAQ